MLLCVARGRDPRSVLVGVGGGREYSRKLFVGPRRRCAAVARREQQGAVLDEVDVSHDGEGVVRLGELERHRTRLEPGGVLAARNREDELVHRRVRSSGRTCACARQETL